MLRARALNGLRRYQEALRPLRPPSPRIHASAETARLLHFRTDSAQNGAPVVLIPSLINPPDVLDISLEASLTRWLAAQGHDVYMVDWGHPAVEASGTDLADHVTQRLLPMLRNLDKPPMLVGYCLGGTLAAAAAACMPVSALVTLATPWHFGGFPDDTRLNISQLWEEAKPICEKLGFVPMEVLQSGFWALDPAKTIGKYADFGEMTEGSDAFAAFLVLEDWANAGPPLTYAASKELFELLYGQDRTGQGEWCVQGNRVNPEELAMPTLAICSSTDRIVPAASSPRLDEQWTLEMGHVGMIVGRRARKTLWEPLSEWLFKQQTRC